MKKLLLLFLFFPLLSFSQELYQEQDMPIYLPSGWSMFGYTCVESRDLPEAFISIQEYVIIIKDSQGSAYLPEWGFNGIGNLQYARGYQVKLSMEILNFQFCPALVPFSDINSNGINDSQETQGCTDITACNYNTGATFSDGSCSYPNAYEDCSGNCLNDANADQVCDEIQESGCTDQAALNYSSSAIINDGSCIFTCEMATVNFSVDASDVITSAQNNVVINGNFDNWNGWGLVLNDQDGDGIYTGSLSVEAGTYQYVHALTGSSDNWSGWGTVGYAPEACEDNNIDEYHNYEFTVGCNEILNLTLNCFGSCGPCENSSTNLNSCDEISGRDISVSTDGYQIKIGNDALHMKGVCWSPHGIGSSPGVNEIDFGQYVQDDATLMADAGINVVRTYGVISDTDVLDQLYAEGIYVMMTVFYGYSDDVESALEHVCSLKDHPAIIGWVVGNEWNYNTLGLSISFEEALATVATVTSAIKQIDPTRIVSTVYGNIPSELVYNTLPDVDVWGLNVYTGSSFGSLFNSWESLSTKPMYLAEYGCDAYNGQTNQEDQNIQSEIVSSLTQEIINNSSVIENGICSGGMLFSFSDEWWKYNGGSAYVQDTESSWSNGAYPDPNMNEEWWGIVDIYRNPRQAYYTYSNLSIPE